MNKYLIAKKITLFNQSGKPLTAKGGIQHSTGNGEDNAPDNWKYFNSGDRKSNAHFFIDDQFIIQNVEINQQAWHGREPANSSMLGCEFCETQNPLKFQERWKRQVWLWAYLFNLSGIASVTIETLRSHEEENELNHRGDPKNHTDPTAFWRSHNKTMDDMRNDVKKQLEDMRHWANEYYQYLIQRGYPITETRFNDPITRGEAFKIFAIKEGFE